MISVFDKKEDCCGCTACKSICSKRAITMKPDKEGFCILKLTRGYAVIAICADLFVLFKIDCVLSDRLHDPRVFAVKHKKSK